ncbi:MerR family transcriptional regulator [Desertihabitans aurantiacus]|uniref:MerR family transcriptional regulator n=1 Tax=Desertihabitans aurantiacus TaxID=2282477 RepID=UPI000DF85C09|nr:MerR family transcriptional regulator [Desertihabitans aurantiacus]
MSREIGPAEFALATGLTPKALRLYAERGILEPASVAPGSGRRGYSAEQLHHGKLLGLLRQAGVPLSELGSARDFDHARWRDQLALRRQLEDFHLAVAERLAEPDLDALRPTTWEAPAQPWVGVLCRFELPEEPEGQLQVFAAMAADLPGIRRTLHGWPGAPAARWWTAAPDTPAPASSRVHELVVARESATPLDAAGRRAFAEHVRAHLGERAVPRTGVLPERREITFAPVEPRPLDPLEEATTGYLELLAFEEHRRRHRLDPLGRGPRRVSPSALVCPPEEEEPPTTVFDVRPAAAAG